MSKQVVCRDAGYDCDFMIRSENEEELVEFVQQHAEEAHDTKMSRTDIEGAWTDV
jgi:predicted small metal-binding protein